MNASFIIPIVTALLGLIGGYVVNLQLERKRKSLATKRDQLQYVYAPLEMLTRINRLEFDRYFDAKQRHKRRNSSKHTCGFRITRRSKKFWSTTPIFSMLCLKNFMTCLRISMCGCLNIIWFTIFKVKKGPYLWPTKGIGIRKRPMKL